MSEPVPDPRDESVARRSLRFLRRHRGRVVFYSAAFVGAMFHKYGASGIGLGVFVIAALSLAQDVDTMEAARQSPPHPQ